MILRMLVTQRISKQIEDKVLNKITKKSMYTKQKRIILRTLKRVGPMRKKTIKAFRKEKFHRIINHQSNGRLIQNTRNK